MLFCGVGAHSHGYKRGSIDAVTNQNAQVSVQPRGESIQLPVSFQTIEFVLGTTVSLVLAIMGVRLKLSRDGKIIKRDRSEENLTEISERIIKGLIAERDAYRQASHEQANLASTYMAKVAGLEKDVQYLKERNTEQAAQIERLYAALRRKDANFFDGTKTET
jgi:hypothetical protein